MLCWILWHWVWDMEPQSLRWAEREGTPLREFECILFEKWTTIFYLVLYRIHNPLSKAIKKFYSTLMTLWTQIKWSRKLFGNRIEHQRWLHIRHFHPVQYEFYSSLITHLVSPSKNLFYLDDLWIQIKWCSELFGDQIEHQRWLHKRHFYPV